MIDTIRDAIGDDLADPDLHLEGPFEVVVLAGNVLLFVAPGTEEAVVEQMAAQVAPGGRLIAGYSLGPDRMDLDRHDRAGARAGLELEDRWSTGHLSPNRAPTPCRCTGGCPERNGRGACALEGAQNQRCGGPRLH